MASPCRKKAGLYFRALMALHGGIVFWTGLWDLIDEHWIAASIWRELFYTVTGLWLLLITGSFQASGVRASDKADRASGGGASGAGGGSTNRARRFLKRRQTASGLPTGVERATPNCHFGTTLVTYVRCLVALFGSVMCWSGVYNIVDEYDGMGDGVGIQLIYITVGGLVLLASDTLSDQAGLDDVSVVRSGGGSRVSTSSDGAMAMPVASPPRTAPAAASSSAVHSQHDRRARSASEQARGGGYDADAGHRCSRRFRQNMAVFGRAVCGLIGIVVTWVGVNNLLYSYVWRETVWRALVYTVVGLLIMSATGGLFGNAGINMSQVSSIALSQRGRGGPQASSSRYNTDSDTDDDDDDNRDGPGLDSGSDSDLEVDVAITGDAPPPPPPPPQTTPRRRRESNADASDDSDNGGDSGTAPRYGAWQRPRFLLNAFTALLGYLTFWTGLEMLLTLHMWSASASREVWYTVYGLAMLIGTNALVGSSGLDVVVTPLSWNADVAVHDRMMKGAYGVLSADADADHSDEPSDDDSTGVGAV